MKGPVVCKVTRNQTACEVVARFDGADGDAAELVIPDSLTLYQGLHSAQDGLGALVSTWVETLPTPAQGVIPEGEPWPEPPVGDLGEVKLRPSAPQGTGIIDAAVQAALEGAPTEPSAG